MSSIADRVKERREALGMNQKALSAAVKALRGSLSQAQISGIESGTVSRPRSLPELAAALQVTVEWLLLGDDALPKNMAGGATSHRPQKFVTFPLQGVQIDLPIYGCTEGLGGLWMLDPSPIQMVERPPGLRYSQAAFGIYCIGGQMAPAFEPKDLLLIDPGRPASSGDDALMVRSLTIGERTPFEGIVRRLVSETETHWRVRQFNPTRVYNLAKAEWPRALFVAGKYSR